MSGRGYFGMGIEGGKCPENLGTLWRSAHVFGAAYIFTVGCRYPFQPTDTTKAWRHVPLHEYEDVETFLGGQPRESEIVGIECVRGARNKLLPRFAHPERAVYVLGAEDRGLSKAMLHACRRIVEIPSSHCLNVAVAGSIVAYDRLAKLLPTAVSSPESVEAA